MRRLNNWILKRFVFVCETFESFTNDLDFVEFGSIAIRRVEIVNLIGV